MHLNLASIKHRADHLVLSYSGHRFKNQEAREFAQHGFLRRIGTLRRCIENIFKIIRPNARKIPDRATLYDAQINVQSFIANVYGSVDNLAWVWVHERGL